MTSYIVTYLCGHSRVYQNVQPPVIGDELWCPKCRRYTFVSLAPDEWRIRCRGCHYARSYGAAKLNAEIGAVRHRKAFTGHLVDLLNGEKVERTFGVETGEDRDPTVTEPLF